MWVDDEKEEVKIESALKLLLKEKPFTATKS
jgi:hypothetical protein